MSRLSRYLLAPVLGALMASPAMAQSVTDVGTPRAETLVVQTFDNRSPNPTAMNPLNQYAVWRGFRELAWGYLWEMDTATGESYPEMADGFPEVLNDDYTHFRIKIRPGIYWSDGEELTVDDFIFTMETSFKYREQLTNVSTATSLIKEGSWKKIDDYTFEIETVETAYDLVTRLGVYTWGTGFNVVPEHVFGPLGDEVTTFENIDPVTLGPYTMHSFDPNGFWQLWERREDWERSSYGFMGEPKPKYVLYKGFGPEETRVLAFVQNQYDIDTFMSPDSIKAAQARNEHIETFAPTFPFHDMGDACSFGVRFHQQKEPYNHPEVRWALALTMDLEQVGLSALSGEFGTYWGTNSVFQTILHWQETCIFESNWLRNWRVLSPEYVMAPDSTDRIVGNYLRVNDERIFDLVANGIELPLDSEERLGYGLEVMKIMVEDMMVIPVMSIPTTIPTNSYYWQNYPKADNFYALPYSWWSSFKKTVLNIEPTGNT